MRTHDTVSAQSRSPLIPCPDPNTNFSQRPKWRADGSDPSSHFLVSLNNWMWAVTFIFPHSIIFISAIRLERVAGAAALGLLEVTHGQQQSHIVLLAPHQDETMQGRRRSPHGPWSTSRPLLRECSQQDSLHQFPLPHSGHVAVIFRFGKVPHRGLFAKIPFLPLALEIRLFRPPPKIHHRRWGSEQGPVWKPDSFSVFESSRFDCTKITNQFRSTLYVTSQNR